MSSINEERSTKEVTRLIDSPIFPSSDYMSSEHMLAYEEDLLVVVPAISEKPTVIVMIL